MRLVIILLSKRIGFIFIAVISIVIVYKLFFSNLLLEYLFNDKILIHKVNSIEKLNEVQGHYIGIELDLVYIDSLNSFDVNHPPDQSNNLSLSVFLSEIKNNEIILWFDCKNIDSLNYKNIFDNIDNLVKQYNLKKNNIIIESPKICLLKRFYKSGYKTSYYYNYPGLYALEEKEKDYVIKEIADKINKCNFTYISSNFKDYPISDKEFPNQKKILWNTGGIYNPNLKYNRFNIRRILISSFLDENIDYILFEKKIKN